jgi:hypothetical protein
MWLFLEKQGNLCMRNKHLRFTKQPARDLKDYPNDERN